MSHVVRHRVHLRDVLEALTSITAAPSSMGNALDRARDGVSGGTADPVRMQGQIEESMLRRAAVFRCVDGLAVYNGIRFAACVDVQAFAKRIRVNDGAVAVAVMRAYQPWVTQSAERALVAVYEWMRSQCPTMPELHADGESSPAQAFRVGKMKMARGVAIRMAADAQVVVATWVEQWNRLATKQANSGQ